MNGCLFRAQFAEKRAVDTASTTADNCAGRLPILPGIFK